MAELHQLDQTYHFILQSFVERAQAPHYTEIAQALSVTPDVGKGLLHDLMAVGIPNCLYPRTNLIASFAPFNNLPTHYRISVEGEQKWFAQCGLESLAICWLFPGKAVQVDAPCLDCGDPIRLIIRDGVIELQEPENISFYVDVPIRKWRDDLPFA